MNAVKGKLLKKLKTIKSIGYLKPESILRVNAVDRNSDYAPPQLPEIQEEDPKNTGNIDNVLDDQESELDREINDKENVSPEMKRKYDDVCVGGRTHVPLSEVDASSFRRPDMNSRTLFDPNLLSAFEQAVTEVKAREVEKRRTRTRNVVDETKTEIKTESDPIMEFKESCPPGGRDAVVLYTTGIGGIRKTFEDCQKIRSLLVNLRVVFIERDISMHNEFKEEMWRLCGGRSVPPRLFIKGRYVGGAEEVLGLHEQGKLKPLIEGIPVDKNEGPCEGCVGFRFVVCGNCNGSRRVAPEEDGGSSMDCTECNENGVIICPFCCC